MKRNISIILTLILILSTVLGVTVSAESYPSLSSSAYCEFTAAKNMNVYTDSNFNSRGTSSPYKKYSASVSKNDVCYIYKITSNYVQLSYPTSSGRRIGFVRTKDLLGSNTNPSGSFTAKEKVNTLKYKNGSVSGYYEYGDKVYTISGTNYNTIYQARSGKREYKLAYVLDTPQKNTQKTRLADVAYNEIGTKGTKADGSGLGDYQKYGRWFGNNGEQWCAQFVSWCVKEAGVSTQIVPKAQACTDMQKSKYYKKWDSSTLGNINKNDVIFFCSNSGQVSHHVGIVYSVSGSRITLIEGNTGNDTVKKNTYTVENILTGKIKNGKDNWKYFCGYIPVE